MTTSKRILSILFVLFVVSDVVAQQVWPVQLTGAMIPPRSLDLGVYGTDRPQDLFFNAMLNDPVEPSLQVRLELSIERNGEVLYMTDPNYLAPPITLSQFQMMQVDGSMLQDYLNNANLVGAQNTGTGAIEIPEGFNQVCLQVYGVERNVPVSNKFCVQGSFVLNQPPQAILPSCGELMELPETQNQLFTWQPMHLGSSNSPGAVEYKFEMVQLPDGTYNANDAFESSLQVYQTTTMTPSLIYTQAEPQLQPGKLYAWRVKAYSMMNPTSKLFQNDGYSEICTFMYYEGEKPGLDVTSFNNPSPTGCEVFNTDYGSISNTEPISTPLVETDLVALGYFTMEVTEATGGAQGFNGKGKVRVPMFNAYVNVAFSGLKVNSDMRVYEVEEVKAIVDQPFALDKVQLQAELVSTTISENYVTELNDFFSYGDGTTRLTSNMNLADPTGNNLPIAMDQMDMPMVSVIGIYFTPRNAFINLVSWKGEEGNSPMRFAATAVQATPYGVKNGSHLVALNEGSAESFEKVLESIELSRRITADVKMDCDCEGAGPLESQASLNIAPEIAVREGDQGVILLEPAKKGEITEQFVGEVKALPDFMINGIDDIVFSADKGYLNLSIPRRGEDYDTARGDAVNTDRGLALTEATARIPEKYNFLSYEPIELKNGSLFIDNDNVSEGRFFQTDLLSLDEGVVDKWSYSVDTMALNIKNSRTIGTEVEGRLRAPLFLETFDYSGFLYADNNTNPTLELDVKPGIYNMYLWYSQFELDESSHVQLEIKDMGDKKLLYPKGRFSGKLSLELSADEVAEALKAVVGDDSELVTKLKQALEVENLNLKIKDLKLTDLEVDPYAELTERYTLGYGGQGKAQIGELSFDISYAELVYKSLDNNYEELGLKIHLIHDLKDVVVTAWADTDFGRNDFPGLDGGGGEAFMGPMDNTRMKLLYNGPGDKLRAKGLDIEVTETSCSCVKETQFSNTGNLQIEDNKLVLPFLKISDGEVETIDVIEFKSVFSASYEINEKNASTVFSRELNEWPINISERLAQFNIDNNLPDQAKLYITGVKIPSGAAKGYMEMTMLYHLNDDKYLIFKKDSIVFANNHVDMTDKYFHLTDDVSFLMGTSRDTLSYHKGTGKNDDDQGSFVRLGCDGIQYFNIHGFFRPNFEVGSKGNKMIRRLAKPVKGQGAANPFIPFVLNTSDQSHNLTKFIATVPAYYMGTLVQANNSKYIPGADDNGWVSLENYNNAIRLQKLGVKIRDKSTQTLTDLGKELTIGSITDRKLDKTPWSFAIPGAEQLIFHPGTETSHKAYLDFNPDKSVEGISTPTAAPQPYSTASWTGIIFEDIQFELDGFKDAKSQGLVLPIQNSFYSFEDGMSALYAKENALPKDKNGLLGGWKYDLTWLSFYLKDNKFEPIPTQGHGVEGSSLSVGVMKMKDFQKKVYDTTYGKKGKGQPITGVYIEGSTLVPLFESEPPKEEETTFIKFAPGWVGFSGLLDFTRGKDTDGNQLFEPRSQMYFNNVERTTYQSAFIPMLGMRLKNGSSINLVFNAGNGELEPTCEFNGNAGLFINDNIVEKAGLPDEVKQLTKGIRLNYNLLKFEGLKINDGATNCGGADALYGMKSIHFGTWGPSSEVSELADGMERMSGLQGFPISVSDLSLKCFKWDNAPKIDGKDNPELGNFLYRFQFPISLNLTGGSEKEEEGTKTAGISAETQVSIIFKHDEKGFHYKWFELNCATMDASFGPFAIRGGINILRSDGADSKWGDGFKGFLDVTFKEVVNLKAVGQYGVTRFSPDVGEAIQNDYRYFFFDLEGSSEKGLIDLLPPSPSSAPILTIYGGGGGLLWNMDRGPSPAEYMFRDPEPSNKSNNFPDNNSCDLDDPLLVPGVNLYGEEYRPHKGRYGGNVSVILGHPPRMPKIMVGDVTLKVGITVNDAGTPGFDYIGIKGNAYSLASSVATRRSEHVAHLGVGVDYYNSSKVLSAEFDLKASWPNDQAKVKAAEVKQDYAKDKKKKFEDRKKEFADKDKYSDKIRAKNDQQLAAAQKEFEDATAENSKAVLINNRDPLFGVDASATFAVNFNTGKWGFKMGSWGDGQNLEPASKLQYSSVSFPKLGDNTFKFYLQAGHDVDGIPPITELIPSWNREANFNDFAVRKPDFSEGGNGFVIGGLLDVEKKGSLGPLSGYVKAKVGFDFSIQEFKEVTCDNSDGKIGLNGWYAKGRAYAFVDARIDFLYDLKFTKGKVNIFDAQLAAIVQAELPNPSHIHGFIKGKYSVLNGAIDGKFNYKFEYGEACSGDAASSPVAGIPVIEDVYPNGEDDKPVQIFAHPKLSTNWKIGSTFSFKNYTKDYEEKDYDSYRTVIDEFKVAYVGPKEGMTREQAMRSTSTNFVSASNKISDDGTLMSMKPNNYLKPNSWYLITAVAKWQVDKGDKGEYKPLMMKGEPVIEKKKYAFFTGPFPDKIYLEMLESSTPGYRQRYWHPGYANPHLRFNTKDPNLKKLFPTKTTVNGVETRNEYIAKITNGDNSFEVPVAQYPGSKTFKIPVADEISVANYYTIPTVTYKDVTTNELTFPDMDDSPIEKGKIYKLEIIRRPERKAVQGPSVTVKTVADKENSVAESKDGGVSVNKKTNKLDNKVDNEIATNTKILYEYHFGVSAYDHLHDKLANVQPSFLNSNQWRNDLSHPEEDKFTKTFDNDSGVDKNKYKVRDDYFALIPKSKDGYKEGFDQYDLDRIKANARITYVNAYKPYNVVKDDRFRGYHDNAYPDELNSYFEKIVQKHKLSSARRKYVKSMLMPYKLYTVANSDQRNKEYDLQTKWNYDFNIPSSKRWDDNGKPKLANEVKNESRLLHQTEIDNGTLEDRKNVAFGGQKDNSYIGNIFNSRQQYSLLYQDIQSRIVVNQIRLLAEIGETEKKAKSDWSAKGIANYVWDSFWESPRIVWLKARIAAPCPFWKSNKACSNSDNEHEREINQRISDVYDSYENAFPTYYGDIGIKNNKQYYNWHKTNSEKAATWEWFGYSSSTKDVGFDDGYEGSYHGAIRIDFPKVSKWKEMNSVVDVNNHAKVTLTLRPDHGKGTVPPGITDYGKSSTVKEEPDKDLFGVNSSVKLRRKNNNYSIVGFSPEMEPQYMYLFAPVGLSGESNIPIAIWDGVNHYWISFKNPEKPQLDAMNKLPIENQTLNLSDVILDKYGADLTKHGGLSVVLYHQDYPDFQYVKSNQFLSPKEDLKEYEPFYYYDGKKMLIDKGKGLVSEVEEAGEKLVEKVKEDLLPEAEKVVKKAKEEWNKVTEKLGNLFPESEEDAGNKKDRSSGEKKVVEDEKDRPSGEKKVVEDEKGGSSELGKVVGNAKGSLSELEKAVENTLDWLSNFRDKSLPYNGIYQNIPGIIDVSHYDWGGPEIAYKDSSPGNSGRTFRNLDGVDLKRGANGIISITDIDPGEYQKYSVNVKEAGSYNVLVDYRSSINHEFILFLGEKELARVTLPATGSSLGTHMFEIHIPIADIGRQVLKIVHNQSQHNRDINLFNIQFELARPDINIVLNPGKLYRIMPVNEKGEGFYEKYLGEKVTNYVGVNKAFATYFRFEPREDGKHKIVSANGSTVKLDVPFIVPGDLDDEKDYLWNIKQVDDRIFTVRIGLAGLGYLAAENLVLSRIYDEGHQHQKDEVSTYFTVEEVDAANYKPSKYALLYEAKLENWYHVEVKRKSDDAGQFLTKNGEDFGFSDEWGALPINVDMRDDDYFVLKMDENAGVKNHTKEVKINNRQSDNYAFFSALQAGDEYVELVKKGDAVTMTFNASNELIVPEASFSTNPTYFKFKKIEYIQIPKDDRIDRSVDLMDHSGSSISKDVSDGYQRKYFVNFTKAGTYRVFLSYQTFLTGGSAAAHNELKLQLTLGGQKIGDPYELNKRGTTGFFKINVPTELLGRQTLELHLATPGYSVDIKKMDIDYNSDLDLLTDIRDDRLYKIKVADAYRSFGNDYLSESGGKYTIEPEEKATYFKIKGNSFRGFAIESENGTQLSLKNEVITYTDEAGGAATKLGDLINHAIPIDQNEKLVNIWNIDVIDDNTFRLTSSGSVLTIENFGKPTAYIGIGEDSPSTGHATFQLERVNDFGGDKVTEKFTPEEELEAFDPGNDWYRIALADKDGQYLYQNSQERISMASKFLSDIFSFVKTDDNHFKIVNWDGATLNLLPGANKSRVLLGMRGGNENSAEFRLIKKGQDGLIEIAPVGAHSIDIDRQRAAVIYDKPDTKTTIFHLEKVTDEIAYAIPGNLTYDKNKVMDRTTEESRYQVYTVDIKEAGTYDLEIHYKATRNNQGVRLKIGEIPIGATIDLPISGYKVGERIQIPLDKRGKQLLYLTYNSESGSSVEKLVFKAVGSSNFFDEIEANKFFKIQVGKSGGTEEDKYLRESGNLYILTDEDKATHFKVNKKGDKSIEIISENGTYLSMEDSQLKALQRSKAIGAKSVWDAEEVDGQKVKLTSGKFTLMKNSDASVGVDYLSAITNSDQVLFYALFQFVALDESSEPTPIAPGMDWYYIKVSDIGAANNYLKNTDNGITLGPKSDATLFNSSWVTDEIFYNIYNENQSSFTRLSDGTLERNQARFKMGQPHPGIKIGFKSNGEVADLFRFIKVGQEGKFEIALKDGQSIYYNTEKDGLYAPFDEKSRREFVLERKIGSIFELEPVGSEEVNQKVYAIKEDIYYRIEVKENAGAPSFPLKGVTFSVNGMSDAKLGSSAYRGEGKAKYRFEKVGENSYKIYNEEEGYDPLVFDDSRQTFFPSGESSYGSELMITHIRDNEYKITASNGDELKFTNPTVKPQKGEGSIFILTNTGERYK